MNLPWDELKNCEAEFERIQEVADRLVKGANATVVLLLDESDQLIASSGAPGKLGAPRTTEPLDERDEAHIQRVGGRVALVTIYPRDTSRYALVLHYVRTASDELCHILDALSQKVQEAGFDHVFPEITDEDMDERSERPHPARAPRPVPAQGEPAPDAYKTCPAAAELARVRA